MSDQIEIEMSSPEEWAAYYQRENARLTQEVVQLKTRLSTIRKKEAERQRRYRQRKATKTK